MKKIYLFALPFLFINHIQAQVTITKAVHEPVIGDSYDTKTIDTTSTLPMTVNGAGVTWNVNGVTETFAINSHTYSSPADYSGSATTFPGVTSVMENFTTGDLSYFKSTPTTYEVLGATLNVAGNVTTINYNTNSGIIQTYPINLGYINNDIGAGAMTTSTISGTFTSTLQTKGDATGTLIFNGGVTYSNCLRVLFNQKMNFSMLSGLLTGTIEQNFYHYFHSSSKFPIFTVEYTHVISPGLSLAGIPPINTIQPKVETNSSVNIGLKENKLNDVIFKAYPNPAKNELNIHMVLTHNESYTIQILNTLGQVVKTISMANLTPGMYNQVINIADLNSGIYSVNVSGSKASGTQKLIID